MDEDRDDNIYIGIKDCMQARKEPATVMAGDGRVVPYGIVRTVRDDTTLPFPSLSSSFFQMIERGQQLMSLET